jgi:hypothetical protein
MLIIGFVVTEVLLWTLVFTCETWATTPPTSMSACLNSDWVCCRQDDERGLGSAAAQVP